MKKVLVLGAGASKAYGYPLGAELRRKILSFSPIDAIKAGILTTDSARLRPNGLTHFVDAFRISQMYSIDAFLARRAEFEDIGKRCISAVLISCEDNERLFAEDPDKDHWYQYLFNHFAQVDWDDLDFSSLSVITFNYDRSLEHYLFGALKAAYGMEDSDVSEKLKTLQILHVYGSLGATYRGTSENYGSYDASRLSERWVQDAASMISVIPEGRIHSPSLVTAREWLEEARSICFLGFGFDALNVQRLAEGGACLMQKLLSGGHTRRTIVGTCFGMTEGEISAAFSKLTHERFQDYGKTRFLPTSCTQLLRETLFLSG